MPSGIPSPKMTQAGQTYPRLVTAQTSVAESGNRKDIAATACGP